MMVVNKNNKQGKIFDRVEIKETLSVFAAFMILFLTSSFVIVNDIFSSIITIGLWLITLLLMLLQVKKITISQIGIVVCLLLAMWISIIINDESITNAIKITFAILTAFIYVEVYSFEKFKKVYVNVLSFLCITSLIGFFLYLLIPALRNLFVVTNMSGIKFSCLIIYVDSLSYTRNMGLFWEPGAFQTFIGLALLIETCKKNINVKRVMLFLITILTTFSTTGYIAAGVICLLLFLNKDSKNQKIKKVILLLLLSVFIFMYFYQDLFFSASKNTVFGKIINFFKGDNNGVITSASVRYNSIIKPLGVFLKNPLFGVGYKGLQQATYIYTLGVNTCTFVNWFAVYGGVFGLIMLIGFIKLAKKFTIGTTRIIIVFITLFILTMSENYVNSAFIVLLALYGYKGQSRIIENGNMAN